MIWIGRFLPPERRAGLEAALRKKWVRALFGVQTAAVIIVLGGRWLLELALVDQAWRIGVDYHIYSKQPRGGWPAAPSTRPSR